MNNPEIARLCGQLIQELNKIEDTDELIDCLNDIRSQLHELSPLKRHPVDCVLWVKRDDVHANEWNPNHVAPPFPLPRAGWLRYAAAWVWSFLR